MTKIIITILTLALGFAPPLSTLATSDNLAFNEERSGESTSEASTNEEPVTVGVEGSSKVKRSAKKTQKACAAGYFRSPLTNRCKKLVTVKETTSTITTTTYNPSTGKATVKKVCKSGYWWNKKTERCNKKKACKIGYVWQSSDNSCKKIICSFGFKVQDSSNLCKRIICEKGKILNQVTGNCVINRNGKYKTCETGWTLDLMTLKCALIGTKGSNDPRSIAAAKSAGIKQSASTVKKYVLKSNITLADIETPSDTSDAPTQSDISTETESTTKDCGEGKFLNPKTNRCKNLQTITETSTGKTITTYDPETGEATTVKVCNEGYYLKEETNRCNKIPADSTSSNSSSSSSSSSNSSSSATKTCPEGKFLNPKTNRCKNLQTVTESSTGKTVTTYDPATGESKTEKICNEGYELNPDTNRCKKKKENAGEEYPLEVPELGSEGDNNFVAIGSVAAIIAVGTGFIIFQFRHEIVKFVKGMKKRQKA